MLIAKLGETESMVEPTEEKFNGCWTTCEMSGDKINFDFN